MYKISVFFTLGWTERNIDNHGIHGNCKSQTWNLCQFGIFLITIYDIKCLNYGKISFSQGFLDNYTIESPVYVYLIQYVRITVMISNMEGILPKGPYPPCLHMADRTLLAGYP